MAMIDTIGRALAGFGAGVAGKGTEYLQQLGRDRKEAMLEDALRVEDLLTAGDVSKARQLVLDRIKNIQRLGGNPSDSQAFLELLDAGDVTTALNEARSLVDYGQSLGMIKRPAAQSILKPNEWAFNENLGQFTRTNAQTGALEFMDLTDQQRKELADRTAAKGGGKNWQIVDGQMVNVDPVTGTARAVPITGLTRPKTENKATDKAMELSINRLNKRFEDVEDRAAVIEANFGQIGSLGEEVRAGNRSAVVPLIVATVKLGDPSSVVSGEEVQNALNTPTPLASLTELFTRKNVNSDVASSVLSKIDPRNPENIDVDEIYATAKALAAANIPVLQKNYQSAYELGYEKLGEEALSYLLPKSLAARVANLSNLSFSTGKAPTGVAGGGKMSPQDREALEWAANNPSDPRSSAIMQRLRKTYGQ